MPAADVFLGIDVGTSGARGCLVGGEGRLLRLSSRKMPDSRRQGAAVEQAPSDWWDAVAAVLRELGASFDFRRVRRIAVDGIFGTLLLIDRAGAPLSNGLMYNDARAAPEAEATLTLELLSDRPVFAPELGVSSHRLGERWLAGGASNSGGAALLAHFTPEEIAALSAQIRPEAPTGLDYYPLPAPGERFPVRDPGMAPRVEPRPDSPALFLQALMEGVVAVEALGYRRLAELGAPWPQHIVTVGGGAANPAWSAIRGRVLGVPVSAAADVESAYGTALLARDRGVPQ